MRGAIKDQLKWQRAIILMALNPDAPRVKIGREVGYTGQMIGFIAKAMGFPPGKAGGYQKKDDEPLVYPPGWAKNPELLSDSERENMKGILEKYNERALELYKKNTKKRPENWEYAWSRPIWMEGKQEVKAE